MNRTLKYALIAVAVAIVMAVVVTAIKVHFFGWSGGAIPGAVVGGTCGAIFVALMRKKAGENQ